MPKNTLSRAQRALLDATFARNTALYGGWSMEEETDEKKAEREAAEKAAADKKAAEEAAKKFEPIASQEQLDKIVSGRLTREREKYSDYDDLKAAKKELDDLKAAGATDQEKAVAAAKKEAAEEANSSANTRIIKSEARAIAAELGFKNSAIAVNSVDLSKVKVSDDGTVDEEAIKAKLNALAEENDWMVAKPGEGGNGKGKPPKPDHSQGGGGGDDSKSVSQVMAERRAAREAKEKPNN